MAEDRDKAWSPQDAWRRFRLEAEAAKNYPMSYAMYVGQTHRDVLLEALLPTLLYIKAVAILDDSLELWLAGGGHEIRAPYRNDLNGRLEYCRDNRLLANVDSLHTVRKERNRLAHEPGTSSGWVRFAEDASIIEDALLELGLARPTPQLEYFCERSAMENVTEPGVAFYRTFTYGVRENGKLALEVSWRQSFDND
jgi:hypothetical protein